MTPSTRQTSFAERVRKEMAAQGLSIRGLARKIDPVNIDRVRRNLHRWLDEGILPNRASRLEVALALGLDPSELPSDDDEESRSMSLDDFLRLRVRELMREELAVKA